MPTVRRHRRLVVEAGFGLLGVLVLLAALAATVGLRAPGRLLGLAYGLTLVVTLVRAVARSGRDRLGPADAVTLTRAVLVGGLTALVADSFTGSFIDQAPVPVMVGLASVALALDAVDGRVARRTGTVTAVGARFDMEVDAFLVLVLSVYDVRLLGGWVLLIGLAAAAHQGWSANIFTTASDMFPRQAVGSVVGIGGMAGAVGGMFIAKLVGWILEATGSYVPIFIIAASTYLLALAIIHLLAPKLEPAKIS